MTQSRFLAALVGPTFVALGLSVLINRALLDEVIAHLSSDYLLVIVVGVLTLVAGLAIVTTHRIWKGWPAILTVLGWLAVIGGFLRVVVPGAVAVMAPSLFALDGGLMLTFIAVALILLGAFLSWKAFAK